MFNKKNANKKSSVKEKTKNDVQMMEAIDTNVVVKETSSDLLQAIVEHYTIVDKSSLQKVQKGLISKEDFLAQVKEFLIKNKGLNNSELEETIVAFKKYIWGYHIIDDLIFDTEISDIRIMNWDNIRVKRLGKRESTNLKFSNKEEYVNFVNYVATKNKTNISDINAIQTFTDKYTNPDFILRFDIMTGFITSTELPYVQIRKIPKKKYTLDDLYNLGMFDANTRDFLRKAAVDASGILFTGKGASGKTTIMNAMIEEIPDDKSGMVIQENEELFSNHPELMFQHIVVNRGESKIQYDLSELARNGLLVDLDYFIIGEIKGGEALYMLNASYTGHQCWASVHGINSQEAMNKLVDYIKYESDYSRVECLKMLHNIRYVVFMKDFKVAEISEVVGWDENKQDLKYQRIL